MPDDADEMDRLAELLAVARIEPGYAQLDEKPKRELLMKLLNDARPLCVMGAEYSELTQSELAIFETAKVMRERFGTQFKNRKSRSIINE